jgi:hypothetical protein
MPREIITIQIGQCGNQSTSSLMQSAPSSGSSSVASTASVPLEFSRNSLQTTTAYRTARMSSSTRRTTTITSRALFSSTWSQEYRPCHAGHQHHPAVPLRQSLQSRKYLHLQGGRRRGQQLGERLLAGREISVGDHGHDRPGGRWF